MAGRLLVDSGGFFPAIKRCYGDIFAPLTATTIDDDAHLSSCYLKHQTEVLAFFKQIDNPSLVLNLAKPEAYQEFCLFLEKPTKNGFAKLNQNGKVTAWKDINCQLKVDSTRQGKADLK